MSSVKIDKADSDNKGGQLYRTLWRWHFYAGLFCIPFILTLSISGAIYLFKPQIENWLDAPYRDLPQQDVRQSPNKQIAAALAALPDARFHSYRLPAEATDAVVISVFSAGQRYLVYVNPFDLSVLDIRAHDAQFVQRVRSFHGELLAGNVGSVLVELAACWAIVLILTGLFLWWPRSAKGIAGVFYPRLFLGGRRFWRDLHAVIGVWVSLVALIFLVSGLPWALVWGSAFQEVRSLAEQDWPVTAAQETQSWRSQAVEYYELSPATLATVQALGMAPPVELSVSDPQQMIWKASSMTQNRPQRADAWIEGSTGNLVSIDHFNEQPVIDRVIGIGVAAHEGQLFGWANQLLGLLTALSLIVLAVSGCVLWYKRKPDNALGAPQAPANSYIGRAVFVTVLVCTVLLPMLLISLLALAVIELAVLRYLPAFKSWLGLADSSVA